MRNSSDGGGQCQSKMTCLVPLRCKEALDSRDRMKRARVIMEQGSLLAMHAGKDRRKGHRNPACQVMNERGGVNGR